MKFTAKVDINMNVSQVVRLVEDASRKGLRDVTVRVTADAVDHSPILTGNNRRSIAAEVSGMGGTVAGEGPSERVVDEALIQSAVYSTSGYGGYLEVGTQNTPARPYFGPARDKEFTESKLGNAIKRHIR